MLNVQPAWLHVNSAEPADCQGDVAAPPSGTQPFGESHCAVKRADTSDFEPSPASCARAPSWVALQTFACAHEELSCSPVWACATPVPSSTAQMAVSMRVLRAIRDVVGLPHLPLERRLARPTVMNCTYGRSKGVNEALVERMPVATKTDSETFAALYERTFPRVYAYVASLLRDRSAAEDVTAQAFERAYRKRRSYRAARGSMDAWVFGIARNAALDELRARKRRAKLEGDPEDEGATSPEDQADMALRREAVRTALASLSGQERDLIALKFAGGLSNGEIARVLRMSESNVGTRLHRTITKLREACMTEADVLTAIDDAL